MYETYVIGDIMRHCYCYEIIALLGSDFIPKFMNQILERRLLIAIHYRVLVLALVPVLFHGTFDVWIPERTGLDSTEVNSRSRREVGQQGNTRSRIISHRSRREVGQSSAIVDKLDSEFESSRRSSYRHEDGPQRDKPIILNSKYLF